MSKMELNLAHREEADGSKMHILVNVLYKFRCFSKSFISHFVFSIATILNIA